VKVFELPLQRMVISRSTAARSFGSSSLEKHMLTPPPFSSAAESFHFLFRIQFVIWY
jgi:hypothetical protein